MSNPSLPLLGMFRVGTNFTRTILELNYDVEVVYDAIGWKHGLVPAFTDRSPYSYPSTPPLVVLKDPWATLVSWFNYASTVGRNLHANTASFRDFLRSPVVFKDDFLETAPPYYFCNPVQMWNSVVWNHIGFSDARKGYVVRYEDLLSQPEKVCAEIAQHYGLRRKEGRFLRPGKVTRNMGDALTRSSEADYTTDRPFNKMEYTIKRLYMEQYDRADLSFVRTQLEPRLTDRFLYSDTTSKNHNLSPALDSYTIYTMCDDSRAVDLITLLESNNQNDGAAVKVIPFNDNVKLTSAICTIYGAELVEPDPFWDRFGKDLFGSEEYRTGVPSWRYFRKLNALSHQGSAFAFIDANVLIMRSLKEIAPALAHADFVFGARSMKGRNFPPWAEFILGETAPFIAHGFNAGFWMSRPGVLDNEIFYRMSRFPGLRKMLSKSPEQSVLSLAIGLQRKNAKLIAQVVHRAANQVSADHADQSELSVSAKDGPLYKGRRVFLIKWTGGARNQGTDRSCCPMYARVLDAAGSRISCTGQGAVFRELVEEVGIK